jgi:thioredoxin reductase (NADPH)
MVWNSAVEDIVGQDRLEAVVVKDVNTGATRRLDVKGLFIAIGHSPATKFLQGAGIEFDEKGYVALKTRSSFTNIPGVFAAGDVADQVYRQAISAAGMGCQAAIDCERWLAEQGIH